MKKLLILSSLLLIFSCSYQNQTFKLKISPQGEFSPASKDSQIFVSVIDSRENTKIIGSKNYYKQNISLSSKDPLPCIFKTVINKNLVNRGFILNKKRRYLELEILELNYNSQKGIFIGSSKGEAKVKAIIKNYNQTKIFEKTFYLTLNQKHAIISDIKTDQKTIQNLISEIISDILKDQSILTQINK